MIPSNILAIEIVVAIEVAASSHALFCCGIRRGSGLSGDRFKQSSLVYLLQTHPRTNKQLIHPTILYFLIVE
jgi:hypothetical protein